MITDMQLGYLYLRAVEGMTNDQVARRTGRSVQTIDATLRRARRNEGATSTTHLAYLLRDELASLHERITKAGNGQ